MSAGRGATPDAAHKALDPPRLTSVRPLGGVGSTSAADPFKTCGYPSSTDGPLSTLRVEVHPCVSDLDFQAVPIFEALPEQAAQIGGLAGDVLGRTLTEA